MIHQIYICKWLFMHECIKFTFILHNIHLHNICIYVCKIVRKWLHWQITKKKNVSPFHLVEHHYLSALLGFEKQHVTLSMKIFTLRLYKKKINKICESRDE